MKCILKEEANKYVVEAGHNLDTVRGERRELVEKCRE